MLRGHPQELFATIFRLILISLTAENLPVRSGLTLERGFFGWSANRERGGITAPLKTVKAVGWHQELLQGRQMRRHDVRQALTSEFGVSSPSRGGRCKGVSLPFVLFAKLGRRRQFVVPLNVRIKLAIRLAVTTAALSKRRSPCRVMAMPIVSQCGPARVHFHDSWCRQDMGN